VELYRVKVLFDLLYDITVKCRFHSTEKIFWRKSTLSSVEGNITYCTIVQGTDILRHVIVLDF